MDLAYSPTLNSKKFDLGRNEKRKKSSSESSGKSETTEKHKEFNLDRRQIEETAHHYIPKIRYFLEKIFRKDYPEERLLKIAKLFVSLQ